MKVVIKASVIEHMREVVETAFPHEACGFFSGPDQEGLRQIETSWQTRNVSEENLGRRFRIDPLEYMRAEKKTSDEKTVLQGVYHSHPNHPAIPSKHDLVCAMPFFSYIIVSVNNGKMEDVRSWILDQENQFIEQEIVIES